jgi:hypothetical protein
MESVIFSAQVYKVQTLVDGGVRVTLDLPETAVMQMAQLAECQRFGVALSIVAMPIEENDLINKGNRNATKGQNKQSQWTPAKE